MMVVLGVGNTMMRDDGIGVRAVQALTQAYILPKSVRVVEGGVAGIRLLPFIQDADDLLIVDAVRGLGAPGTIYRLDVTELPMGRGPLMSAHEFGVAELISMADLLGRLPRTRILGIQPFDVASIGMDLSEALRDCLPGILSAIAEELRVMGVDVKRRIEVTSTGTKETGKESGHHA